MLPTLAAHHPLIAPGRSYCTACWTAAAALAPGVELTAGPVPDFPGRLRELAARARHDRLTAATDADRRFAAGQQVGLDAARDAWERFRALHTTPGRPGPQWASQPQEGALHGHQA
jgi:hypothetical protein